MIERPCTRRNCASRLTAPQHLRHPAKLLLSNKACPSHAQRPRPRQSDARIFRRRVYRANADPWNFASSPYEAAKYRATLEALPRERYTNAFEAGCSIGVLTAQLAPRCERLLCIDLSEAALAQARERCAALPQVRFERRMLPGEFPMADGPFDLIVRLGGRLLPRHARPAAPARTMRSRGWQREATCCWSTGRPRSMITR